MDQRLKDIRGILRRPVKEWQEQGWWGRVPLWQRVAEMADQAPDKSAVIDNTETISYADLWARALRHSAAMGKSGVAERDVILVQLPNWHEFACIAIAAEAAGIVFAFCPIQWDLRETVRALRLTKPKIWYTTRSPRTSDDRAALITEALAALGTDAPKVVLFRSVEFRGVTTEERWLDGIAPSDGVPVENARGSHPVEIAVTSGSTGDPKGVLHVHDSVIATIDSTIKRQGIVEADIIHLAVPVGHTFGYFYGVRCALQARGTLLLQERWDAHEMIELVYKHQATISLGPSAFLIDLLGMDPKELDRLSSLRVFTHGGDSLPGPIVRKAIEAMPFRISRALGMTEFGHACSTDAGTPVDACVETLGTPQPEMTFRILDEHNCNVPPDTEGRIFVSGPFLFAGYLSESALNENILDDAGFFDTGDLGLIDRKGYLRITGRLKNVIRRGAETVPVSLLEDVLATHPNIVHAVVVGVPDPRLGELPVACVQLKPNQTLTFADIEALFEAQKITKKFWPVDLKVFDHWPISATGKIDRRMIVTELQVRR